MNILQNRRDSLAKVRGKNRALKFIFLLGIVSLLSDLTYEGARKC